MRRASQLSNVMEHGLGSPVVMAILYVEVARRAGLRLHAMLLDDAHYCLLWPAAGGSGAMRPPPPPQLLIDPYHKGDLLGAAEVGRCIAVDLHPPMPGLAHIGKAAFHNNEKGAILQ